MQFLDGSFEDTLVELFFNPMMLFSLCKLWHFSLQPFSIGQAQTPTLSAFFELCPKLIPSFTNVDFLSSDEGLMEASNLTFDDN